MIRTLPLPLLLAIAIPSGAREPSLPLDVAPLTPSADAIEPPEREIVDPEGLLDRFDSRLERLASFKCDFTQINNYAAVAFADTFSGRLYARMPADFILRYSDPPGQFIRSDGLVLSMYVPENQQMVEGVIYRDSDDMNFFKLLRSYIGRSDAIVSKRAESAEARRVVLRPLDGSTLRELRIDLDTKILLPTRVEIVDENRNVSSYRLDSAEVDRTLDDEIFSPPLPDSVEIIRQ